MRIHYFGETDTLYIELRLGDVVETRDLDENTPVGYGAAGNLCATTPEHARERASLLKFTFEDVAA